MPKGYSKEIMEALFQEEQKQQEELKQREAEQQAARQRQKQQADVNFKLELMLSQLESTRSELAQLHKKISRLRIAVVIAIVLTVITAAIGLNESLKELMYTLP